MENVLLVGFCILIPEFRPLIHPCLIVGVLTKPDTLTAGAITARETWREVLEGRQYPLRHGYYCVRLPDDEERSRNRTRAALQQSAATFFDSTPPWNAITDRHRLGIPGLLTDLSKLLMYLIEQACVEISLCWHSMT